jgi:galactonate dehydratase
MTTTDNEEGLTRRGALGVLGAVAGGVALVNHTIAADNNPAAQVGDSTSTIRITGLRTHRVQHKVYVELQTSHKVTGWGEVSALVPTAAEELAKALFALLDGENPTRIEHLWQKLYRAHRDIRGGPFMCHTLAGLDMALWDITGKLWGVPVYRLLGGPTRDKIRVYPTPRAIKTGGSVGAFSGNPSDIEQLVKNVKHARQQVGPDGTVMFDAHCAIPPPALIQFAAAIKAYDVLFIEEPAVPGNIEVFKRLKAQIPIPLAAGERDRTIWEFIPYLQERCLDVLQPDVAQCGGITQMKKIAVLAEAYHTPLAPHCITSPLAATASLSVAASIPFLLIHETDPTTLHWGEQFMNRPWKVDEKTGDATLPEGPGLGVEIDTARLAKVAADPKYKWRWPGARYADGSVADY